MQCSALYILYYPGSKIVSQSCSLLNSHSLSHCHSTHWSVIIELLSRHLLFWLMTTIGSIKGNSLHVLFQDTDWEVLERVLVNLPLLLQNKTLILSGKHDLINSLCHQLCAMVWMSYKGLMYNICLNEMNVVFSWLIFSFYGFLNTGEWSTIEFPWETSWHPIRKVHKVRFPHVCVSGIGFHGVLPQIFRQKPSSKCLAWCV